MDRRIVYQTEVPYDVDILWSQKNSYRSVGQLIDTILGNSTELNGFNCTPSTPAALSVIVEPGQIYSEEITDSIAYGSSPSAGIPSDSRLLMKQAQLLDAVTLNTPAPAGVGESIKYLVQIAYSTADDDISLRQFFNAASESVSNRRSDIADVQIKAGIAASTGTEATPTPDAGFTGAWVITVANGQTEVTSGDIAEYTDAPFIKEKLKDKISEATADERYYRVETGDVEFSYRPTSSPKSGWIPAVEGTIGNASSGATIRANADTEALYTLFWDGMSDTDAPVSGGRGASAAADFAADKTLTIPRLPGRTIGIAGAGTGLTVRALGEFLGEETHQLTEAQMPAHSHTLTNGTSIFKNPGTDPGGNTVPGAINIVNITVNPAGGNEAHNNMQPTSFMNAFIKL